MPLFFQHDLSNNFLSEEDSRHAIKVLRLSTGSLIELTDGKGKMVDARITKADAYKCQFESVSTTTVPKRGFSIHLAIAPTKNADRMEWMTEKCVEIGVDQISFLLCKTSERKSINIERLEKIAVNALKQSQQAWLPVISPLAPFQAFIADRKESSRFIAFVDETNPVTLRNIASPGKDVLVMIGPEGDFTADELSAAIDVGFKKVSLGPSRLRTETAGLVAVAALNQLNQ